MSRRYSSEPSTGTTRSRPRLAGDDERRRRDPRAVGRAVVRRDHPRARGHPRERHRRAEQRPELRRSENRRAGRRVGNRRGDFRAQPPRRLGEEQRPEEPAARARRAGGAGAGASSGPGVDTSTSAARRSGMRAAKRTATRPPNETPQIAARSTRASVERGRDLVDVVDRTRAAGRTAAAPTLAASENVSTRNDAASASTAGRMYSQRPWRPGMSTSGGPLPRSIRSRIDLRFAVSVSVPQRLSGLQRVLNPLERLPLAAQLEERLALEVEQVLLADRRLVRQRAAGEDRARARGRRPRRDR